MAAHWASAGHRSGLSRSTLSSATMSLNDLGSAISPSRASVPHSVEWEVRIPPCICLVYYLWGGGCLSLPCCPVSNRGTGAALERGVRTSQKTDVGETAPGEDCLIPARPGPARCPRLYLPALIFTSGVQKLIISLFDSCSVLGPNNVLWQGVPQADATAPETVFPPIPCSVLVGPHSHTGVLPLYT